MSVIFRPEMRLRVDWDGDGYLNGGVPDGAPPNLVSNPIYVAPLLMQYLDDNLLQSVEIIKETTVYGFEIGRVEGDNVTSISVGLDSSLTKPDNALENLIDFAKLPVYGYWERKEEPEAYNFGGVVHEYVFPVGENLDSVQPSGDKSIKYVVPQGFSLIVYWVRARKLEDSASTTDEVNVILDISEGAPHIGSSILGILSKPINTITLPESANDWSGWIQRRTIVYAPYSGTLAYRMNISGTDDSTGGGVVQVTGMMLLHDDLGSDLFPLLDDTQVDYETYENRYDGGSDPTSVTYDDGTGLYTVEGETESGYSADTENGINVSTALGTFTFDNETSKIVEFGARAVTALSAPDNGHFDPQVTPQVSAFSVPLATSPYAVYYGVMYHDSEVEMYFRHSGGDMPDWDTYFYFNIYDAATYEINNYWKPTGGITHLDGLVVVEPTSDYVFTFHARAEAATTIDIQPKWFNIEDGSETLDTAVNGVNIGTDWTRVDIPFTAIGGSNRQVLSLSIDYTDTTYFDITGIMVTEGSGVHPYHVGAIAHRDVIQDDLKSVEWQSGRNNFDDSIAFEGTLEATLNNDNLLYVPDSIFKQNLKVVLEVYYNFEWVTLWTGWTKSIEMVTGETTNREAYLSCVQGIELLREAEFSYQPIENITMDKAVKDLIGIAGWKSAYDNFTWQLAFNARLGENTYLQDVDAIFSRIDEGALTHELIGMDWGRRTKLADALSEVLDAENAKLWLDRNGGLVLVNRYHEINQETEKTINLDTDVQEANYRFGEDIVNQVEIVYSKKEEVEKQPVWNGTVSIPARVARNIYGRSTVLVPLEFNFTEGRPITITKLYESVQDMDIVVTGGGRELEFSEWDYQVHIAVNSDGTGQYYLQLRNNLSFPVNVNITVYADYIQGSDAQPLVVADLDAQQAINAVHREIIENKQLSNDDHATSLGLWILNRKSLPKGEFTTLLKAVQESSNLQFIQDVQVGTVVALTESTTNETDRQHIVIAEEGSYQAGDVLRMNYTTAFIDELGYAQLGDEMEYDNLSVIPTRPADVPMIGVDGDDTYIIREDSQSVRVLRSTQYGSTFWYSENDPRIPYLEDLQGGIRWASINDEEIGNPFKTPLFLDNSGSPYYFHGGDSSSVLRGMAYGHYRYAFGAYIQAQSTLGASVNDSVLKFDNPIMMISNVNGADITAPPSHSGSDRVYTKEHSDFLLPLNRVVIFDVFGKSQGDELNAGYYMSGYDTGSTEYADNLVSQNYGAYAVIRLDKMTKFQLEPSTTYYGKVNGLVDGGGVTEISIIELTDDMVEHISTITFTNNYEEHSFSFTTSSDCELVVIGYRVLTDKIAKIKAMGLTDTNLTLDEMEVQNKQAFRIYV